jgi:putative transposase
LDAERRATASQRKNPNHDAVNETVIRINNQQFWLYAAADPKTTGLLHKKLEPPKSRIIAHAFVTEVREKHDIDDAVFLIDGSLSLKDACSRQSLDFRYTKHGTHNSVKRIFIK